MMAATRLLVPLRQFLAWWIGELSGLVPAWLRRRLVATTDMLVVLAGEDEVVLCRESSAGLKVLGRLDLRTDPPPHQKLLAILQRHGLTRKTKPAKLEACVRLGADKALRTVVDLPLAAEENLDEVVSFELDRHTPFNARQAAFAHRVIERDAIARRLRIDLTVVPLAAIETAIALAGRLHLDLNRVDIADPGSGRAASGNLLPASAAMVGRRGAGLATYVLAATAVLLALVALYLPVYQERQKADTLAQQFAAVKRTAEAAAKLQHEIDRLRKDARFLVDRKREAPTVSKLLFETTRILPDNTWLGAWQLKGSEIQLIGYTRSASSLVELLEQSKQFRGTTFRAPVTQDAGTGRERFHVAAQVVRDGTP